MRMELLSAANFLVHLVRLANKGVSEPQLTHFQENIIKVLTTRYIDHWFPNQPFHGSGFRCIRINQRLDPIIVEAGEATGLTVKFLKQILPTELALWIDPKEVSYRIGENGSTCVLYECQEGMTEWIPCLSKSKSLDRNPLISNPNTTKDPITDYISKRKMSSIEQLATYVYK